MGVWITRLAALLRVDLNLTSSTLAYAPLGNTRKRVWFIFYPCYQTRYDSSDGRVFLFPTGLDDIVAVAIRDEIDFEEFMKDPQRVKDHIVAKTGLKDLQFGEFRYLGIWVSAQYIKFGSLS